MNRQQSLEERTQIKLLRIMQGENKKLKTMRHYDQQAEIYNIQYLDEQNAKIKEALNIIEIKSNELILDQGCGTGFFFPYINKQTGLLVGLDFSSKSLQLAKKRTKKRFNIVLVRADADNTPFPVHIFDKIFVMTLLQNMPDTTKTISEMKRVGKPEAIFVLTGLKKKYTQESFENLIKKAQLKILSLNSDESLKGYVAVCANLE